MIAKILKVMLLSLLIVLPIRMTFELFPDQPFWHMRELLDFPGSFVRGITEAILYAFVDDPLRYTSRIKSVVNFLWLYVFVSIIVALTWRLANFFKTDTVIPND